MDRGRIVCIHTGCRLFPADLEGRDRPYPEDAPSESARRPARQARLCKSWFINLVSVRESTPSSRWSVPPPHRWHHSLFAAWQHALVLDTWRCWRDVR
eukprot:6188181-Pleurochrysis_carterae.AAC.1